jgi:hypothetical protein
MASSPRQRSSSPGRRRIPRRDVPATQSVQHFGTRNPWSTAEINRRAQQQGVIDLTQTSNGRAAGGSQPRHGPKYSTPNGQRKSSAPETENLSRHADNLQNRWGEGSFRWVHKGQYAPNPRILGDDGGPRNGEYCVIKEFKTGSVYEASYFLSDLKTVSKAGHFIEAFNNERIAANRKIYLNRPTVWAGTCRDSQGRRRKYLVEPMLEGEFLKFNSNSGYVNGADVLQSLSHFSYHHSNGQYLLCDLQGGHYADAYILTDPVIMSTNNSKTYGPMDLGSEGIENFFVKHKCNPFCKRHWRKPIHPQRSSNIPCRKGTAMSLTIGTRKFDAERKADLAAMLATTKRR